MAAGKGKSMKRYAPLELSNQEKLAYYNCEENRPFFDYGTAGGWKKYEGNPVFGGEYATVFDVSVLREPDGEGRMIFRMWFSWRREQTIGYTESEDGIHWNEPVSVLKPLPGSDWEADEVNRPTVLHHEGKYMMWYTGQMGPGTEEGRSAIGLAESSDGITWIRRREPVLKPEGGWEEQAALCPTVLYDEDDKLFKMWYAAGNNYEPDAIGYACSKDGIQWEKPCAEPVLAPDPSNPWESYKLVAPFAVKEDGWFYLFYVGHLLMERAQIGMARSSDGISGWEKHPENPLISPDEGSEWDNMSAFKPSVCKVGDTWMLWYNGAYCDEEEWMKEQIGLAVLKRNEPGFW